ncbi:type II toxin-antitoxin system Y4mF family antitoxin [Sinomonas halotolerans]|uniref:Type II toxin-antitoxin system Y4mF family antitoxin n=1 Tax=Sinomonas halotolerans TaxID=1644133 RepID=A0ABU9WZ01_9MICC
MNVPTSPQRTSAAASARGGHDAGRALAAEVRARRRALGLNQRDLAELAGVSERFVRFVEQAKPSIQLDALLAVLDALGLGLAVRPHTPRSPESAP